MRSPIRAHALVSLFFLGAACSSSGTQDKPDSSSDVPLVGTGGRAASGGASGTLATGGRLGSGGQGTSGVVGAGGAVGRGGAVGTGGAVPPGGGIGVGGGARSGGALGSGGTSRSDGGVGTGGTPGAGGRGVGGGLLGTGGRGSGGAGGTIRNDASSDAADDLGSSDGKDAVADSADLGVPDSPADAAVDTSKADGDGPGSGTLDDCFQGLPAPVGLQMVATKATADGRVRIRIALDTEDRMGTSGSYGWGMIRLGVEVDGAVTCIQDRASLKYTGSHHNCSDKATATSGSTTYSFAAPDRPSATLTIESNGTSTGPYSLSDTACTMRNSTGTVLQCRSGGPC
jgi:hypothetical protein